MTRIKIRWDNDVEYCTDLETAKECVLYGLEIIQSRDIPRRLQNKLFATETVEELQDVAWEITRDYALRLGRQDFVGHGRYFVPAEVDMGCPRIEEMDEEEDEEEVDEEEEEDHD